MFEFLGSLWRAFGNILASLALLYLLCKLFRKPLKFVQDKAFARAMKGMTAWVNATFDGRKKELFAPLWNMRPSDKEDLIVLEIGSGAGANFKYFPEGVSFISVDPNSHFKTKLEKTISAFPHIKLKKYVVARGEDMTEIPDNHCDAVVSTIVLCSVDNMDQILKEVKRVLKPGGKFFYLEHIMAPRTVWCYYIQSLMNSLWMIIFDGCRLDRHTDIDIDRAGFAEVKHTKFHVGTWFLSLRYMLLGEAQK